MMKEFQQNKFLDYESDLKWCFFWKSKNICKVINIIEKFLLRLKTEGTSNFIILKQQENIFEGELDFIAKKEVYKITVRIENF